MYEKCFNLNSILNYFLTNWEQDSGNEFKFNYAYPSGVETFEVYEEMVHPIIRHLFEGFNGIAH